MPKAESDLQPNSERLESRREAPCSGARPRPVGRARADTLWGRGSSQGPSGVTTCLLLDKAGLEGCCFMKGVLGMNLRISALGKD